MKLFGGRSGDVEDVMMRRIQGLCEWVRAPDSSGRSECVVWGDQSWDGERPVASVVGFLGEAWSLGAKRKIQCQFGVLGLGLSAPASRRQPLQA